MGARVTYVGSPVQVFAITKAMSRSVGNEVVPKVMKLVKDRAQIDYHNLMAEVKSKLSPGSIRREAGSAFNSETGAPVRLSYLTPDGKRKKLRTRFWLPLSKAYRKRKPRSRQFWHKTGKLSAAMARVRKPGVSVEEHRANRSHHKGKINARIALRFHRLPPALDRYVRYSFVEGKAPLVDRSSIAMRYRQGLGRLLIPETDRSWIRDLSAALGVELRKNLRKI